MRTTMGLRNKGERPRRERALKIALSAEEYEAIFAAAGYTDEMAATWARDVLLSRSAALFNQRMLIG